MKLIEEINKAGVKKRTVNMVNESLIELNE